MCGIAGIFENTARPGHEALGAMLRSMISRGPDDEGRAEIPVSSGGNWQMGVRRLAILDLSPAGHQPMCDAQTGAWIACNGEVFNFQELRDDLRRAGVSFQSHGDTEVVLKGYAAWGEALFEKLEGMFAIALWDAAHERMLLVRDRHGIKPLYYFADRERFLFASELRALLATGLIPRKLDAAGLDSYLKFGAVQEPASLVAGVQQLTAGSCLRWRPGHIGVSPYVRMLQTVPATNGHSRARANLLEELQASLERAVRLRLVSDVPLGVFLSAGMDSGAVASLASAARRPVKTFTVTFQEKQFAEGQWARATARAVASEHTELTLSQEELFLALPRALAAMDQPTVDGINTYFVSQMTKQAGVTVALSGLGGDELFGGYRSFRQAPKMERIGSATPAWLRSVAGRWIENTSPASNRLKFAAWLNHEDGYGDPYFVTRMLLLPSRIAEMAQPEWLLRLDFSAMAPHLRAIRCDAQRHDAVNRVSCFELATYLRNTLLRDTDCMSMAHSLEVRVPFLDHQLTDVMLRIPGAWKLDRRQNKPLLAEALRGKLPPELLARPKRGFEFPWPAWLRGELRHDVETTLAEPGPVLAQALQWEHVRALWREFLAGREHWSRPWLFYVLRKWTEQHLAA